MKAAELDDSTANRIQLLIHPNIGLSVQNAMRSIRFYAKLKTETCLIAINQWPVDGLDTSAAIHQPQLQDGRDNRTRTDTAAPTHYARKHGTIGRIWQPFSRLLLSIGQLQ